MQDTIDEPEAADHIQVVNDKLEITEFIAAIDVGDHHSYKSNEEAAPSFNAQGITGGRAFQNRPKQPLGGSGSDFGPGGRLRLA